MSYLDNSQFGQVAGSLLAKKNRVKVRERNEALAISAILSLITNQQQKLAERVATNITMLDEDYNRDKLARETIYNKANENRALYEDYLQNPEQAINKKAIDLYNNNSGILGSGVTFADKSKLTGSTKVLADKLWSQSQERARIELESYKDNPLYTSETFQAYNQAYYDAYKAELLRYRDDPTKKSVIVNAASKIFPSWFDSKIGDLQANVDLQTAKITTQENLENNSKQKLSEYIASIPKMTKDESVQFIEEEYTNILSAGELRNLITSVQSKNEDRVFTKNDIISIALSNQILNNQNLSQVQKEIQDETERYKLSYLQNLQKSGEENPTIPVKGDANYNSYIEGLNDRLDRNVYNINPITQKLDDIQELIDSGDPTMMRIGNTMLANLQKDEVVQGISLNLTRTLLGTPEAREELKSNIQTEIDDAAENNRKPLYTNTNEYISYFISEFLEIYDLAVKSTSLLEESEEEE